MKIPWHRSNTVGRLVASLLGVMLLGSCRPAPKNAGGKPDGHTIVIGVSLLNLSSEFIVMLDRAMEAKAAELGVKLVVNDAQRDAARQVQQVENLIAQDVDAIILNPCEVDASSPAVDKARAAGIPIINVNSETRSVPTAFVGSHDEESAELAMNYIAERLHGQGNIVMIQGFLGQTAQINRAKGARTVLARNPGLHLVAEQTAEWDRAKAMTLMENWIQSFGDKIDAVFAQNDEMAIGAVHALEEVNLKKRVPVVGIDAIQEALQMVKAGRLDATVFQDARAQGSTAVETACRIVRGQPYDKQVFIPFHLVSAANIGAFTK
jgi:inositol transport system substrate-binding protein